MNEEELNEEESLQEPDPSSGVAAPDFTLEQALLTKGRSLLGVGTSAIVRNIYTKISKIDGVQEMITKAQEQLPSISQKGVQEFKTQAAGRIQEIMRKLSESSFDVETLKRAVGKDQSGGLGGGGLPSDDDEEEEEDIRGDATDEQIMQAYRERTGELDLDPFRGKTPEQTTRKDIGPILSPESDLYLFEKTGRANINRIKSNFTEQEIRLLKSFENHHAVPLKQSGWLVYGLPQDELGKTQFYMAQRGLKGGNVLEQIRIYPEGIHDQAHKLGERIIGQMRKRGGRSIEKVLGDLKPDDYFAIKTFEGRKQYIDKFLDGITEIDNKINKVLDALYANRLNDDTALDALIDINENVDDPKSLGILDRLLEQIEEDPFIQKPLDDTANIQRSQTIRKEIEQVPGSVNRYLRGVIERNRQKFSKYSTFDEALDDAEKLLEDDKGQRSIFYDADGSEQYVSFAEQAERLARLLFENQ